MPLYACLCSLLQSTQRKYALLLAPGSSSQAEGRRLWASCAGLSSPALLARETRIALQVLITPSVTTAGGVFVGVALGFGHCRIRPSAAAKLCEREVCFLLWKHEGVLPAYGPQSSLENPRVPL